MLGMGKKPKGQVATKKVEKQKQKEVKPEAAAPKQEQPAMAPKPQVFGPLGIQVLKIRELSINGRAYKEVVLVNGEGHTIPAEDPEGLLK